ncbi:hypothetical protein ACH4VR_36140 [Streptomyces sp. NPDC020883]|uniref:hypothetical protein n=1 Tax=Streptomyces sp. NPDC020883 TaxID=3365099 RepID=UPI0037A00AFF
MQFTSAMQVIMRQNDLSGPMVRAILSSGDTEVIDSDARTAAALVDLGIMHSTTSALTDRGKALLTALKATQCATLAPATSHEPAAPPQRLMTSHFDFARGSLPQHAKHPDVRAALNVLASLRHAELTAENYDRDIRGTHGLMVAPSKIGSVRVYWLKDGQHLAPDGEAWKTELKHIADRFSDLRWEVDACRSTCVTAWRPTNGGEPPILREATLVRTPRGDEGPVSLTVVGGYAQAIVNGVAWPASSVEPVTSAAPELPPAPPVQVRPGDLVEATVWATNDGKPATRTIRVRVDRKPWPINDRNTTLSDGKEVVAVLTDTIRVIETADEQQDTARDWAVLAVTTTTIPADGRDTAVEMASSAPHLTAVSRVPGGDWEPMVDPDQPPWYAFEVNGDLMTGTLARYAKHWEAAYYSGEHISTDVRTWAGAVFTVRVQYLGTDNDSWMRYRLSVGDQSTFVALDGRA